MRLNISAWSIRRPVPALVLFMVLMVLGTMSFQSLPVTRFPNIDVPIVQVRVYQSGADLNDTDSYGLAPLHWAAVNGSMDLAKLLINRGANLVTISHQLGGLTPTGVAKIMGYDEMMQFFVSWGGM